MTQEIINRLKEALESICAREPLPTKYGDEPCLRCQHCGYRWPAANDERHGPNCAYVIARSTLNQGGDNE